MIRQDALLIAVFGAGLAGAYACVRADIERRRLKLSAAMVTAAVVGLEMATFLVTRLLGAVDAVALLAAFAAGSAGVFLTAYSVNARALIVADMAATSSAVAVTVTFLALLLFTAGAPRPTAIVFAIALLVFFFLWREGRRAMQWQRPDGIVIAEFLILGGTAEILHEVALLHSGGSPAVSIAAGAIPALGGLCLLALILPRHFRVPEERRIIAHIGEGEETLQPEYAPPAPECPFPERWKMYDTMTAELEVLDFLTCLVTTLKPSLIVETGSFAGISTLALAQGLQKNGFGKIVSCEFDTEIFAKAKERIAASGLMKWIDLRNESSLEMSVDGPIDLLFSDSDQKIREHEVRKFLHQMNPNGVILMHDAGSHFGIVRKAALAMEQEGLISVVLLPTPRGLAIAQRSKARRASEAAAR